MTPRSEKITLDNTGRSRYNAHCYQEIPMTTYTFRSAKNGGTTIEIEAPTEEKARNLAMAELWGGNWTGGGLELLREKKKRSHAEVS